jgi:hypothetical protein
MMYETQFVRREAMERQGNADPAQTVAHARRHHGRGQDTYMTTSAAN